jgi:hypothetical protein
MAAPESKREETKPWRTLIVADSERVNAELSTLRRHRRKRVLCQDFGRHVPALVRHALPQLDYYRLSAPTIIATRMLGHFLFCFQASNSLRVSLPSYAFTYMASTTCQT